MSHESSAILVCGHGTRAALNQALGPFIASKINFICSPVGIFQHAISLRVTNQNALPASIRNKLDVTCQCSMCLSIKKSVQN